jgi:hypothetical protein
MSEKNGPFPESYRDFLARREGSKGYDFQQAPAGSAAPPVVTFAQKLRWWTWDRWRRRKKIRAERDRRLQEILQIKQR